MGTTNLSRDEVRDNQIDRLIDAIVLVVSDCGVDNAGVKVICHRAGISLKTFYDHFDSREQLFLEAYDVGVDALFDEAVRTYVEGDRSWEERIEHSMSRFLQVLAQNPPFTKFFVVEARRMGADLRDHIDESIRRAYDLFVTAQPVSDLDIDAYTLAELVIGGIFTVIYTMVLEDHVAELPAMASKLSAFVQLLFRERSHTTPDGGARRRG